jgi:predicted HTH domain antitoxin
MTFSIPDEVVRESGLTEQELLVEIACRLFDADKLHLSAASRLAGLSRVEFEEALRTRKIPIYRPTIEDLMQDLETIKHLEQLRRQRAAG